MGQIDLGNVIGPQGLKGEQGIQGPAGPGSNRNLLHNWDFRNPVNQRGASGTITPPSYFFDRWMIEQGSAAIVANSGINLIHATVPVINQKLENVFDTSKAYTISAKIDGVIYSTSFTPDTSSMWHSLTETGSIGVRMCNIETVGLVSFANNDTVNDHTISLVKLELGSVSTLANDPPANYGEELEKCQRYFVSIDVWQNIGSGRIDNSGMVCIQLSLPCAMRIAPSIIGAPHFFIYTDAVKDIGIIPAGCLINLTGVQVALNQTFLELANKSCTLYSDTKFSLSADL